MADYVLFSSYGNDSIALIQHAHEQGLKNLTVLYSETGWAKDDWPERVLRMEAWAQSLGFATARTTSKGMKALVREPGRGWPRQGMQFCTKVLKIEPALAWLAEHDPQGLATCLVGVRRAESVNRRGALEITPSSPSHGGRTIWAPLVAHSHEERDALILRAGFDVLPHRSMECFPCINSNRKDILLLAEDPARVDEIADMEAELGHTKLGKPRTMFRPYHYMGATGIREVVRWAQAGRGKFSLDDGTAPDCGTGGFCGTV